MDRGTDSSLGRVRSHFFHFFIVQLDIPWCLGVASSSIHQFPFQSQRWHWTEKVVDLGQLTKNYSSSHWMVVIRQLDGQRIFPFVPLQAKQLLLRKWSVIMGFDNLNISLAFECHWLISMAFSIRVLASSMVWPPPTGRQRINCGAAPSPIWGISSPKRRVGILHQEGKARRLAPVLSWIVVSRFQCVPLWRRAPRSLFRIGSGSVEMPFLCHRSDHNWVGSLLNQKVPKFVLEWRSGFQTLVERLWVRVGSRRSIIHNSRFRTLCHLFHHKVYVGSKIPG